MQHVTRDLNVFTSARGLCCFALALFLLPTTTLNVAAQDGSSTASFAASASPGSGKFPVPRDYLGALKAAQGGESADVDGTRVFGGTMAEEGDFPWQVALLDPNDFIDGDPETRFEGQFCGGSIIARQWILTAAHCVVTDAGETFAPQDLLILTGATDLRTGGEMREVGEIIVHENYRAVPVENDIALLKLAEPIQQSAGPVGAISLAETSAAVTAPSATVIGWGKMENGKWPFELLQTSVDVISNEQCNANMGEQFKNEMADVILDLGTTNRVPMEVMEEAYARLADNIGDSVLPSMLCAGTATGERTSCSGDSGGPLMVRQDNGSFLQVGIVSWGRIPLQADGACGHENLYSVYTHVGSYFDWIASHVRG